MRLWPLQRYRRYEIALLCTIGTLLCYADRTNIGIALPAFEKDHVKQGQVLSAFYYGYICTQILGAHLAARYGPKRVLLCGVLMWTCFDLLTIATVSAPLWLRIARVGMGLGEGILFPTLHTLSAAWYPAIERSRLMSIVSSGVDLGTILAMGVSPVVLEHLGWRAIFVVFGALSSVWIAVFAWRGSSKPENDSFITLAEKAAILAQRGSVVADSPPWRALVSNRHAWAIYASHFAFNYGWYVLLGWMPQYLQQKVGLTLASSGLAAACPYVAGYVGVLFWGYVSDVLLRNHRVLTVRKAMNGLGLVGAAVWLFLLRFASSAPVAVAMLSATLFFARAATLGYWVNMVDIGPSCAGHIMGVSNTIATIPGVVGNVLTGFLLGKDARNWDAVFLIACILLVAGAAAFQIGATDAVVFAPTARRRLTKPRKDGCLDPDHELQMKFLLYDNDDDDVTRQVAADDKEFYI
ncbi:sialin-like protein [Achlya hypogyna]|uniref:Sialin-like protein n=1 Tax=Achlya hypogyna TaxID=1202772 RepID=A0A1V9YKV8_ACHHY|nr:sialin-like protein [Achlya hypogyna]